MPVNQVCHLSVLVGPDLGTNCSRCCLRNFDQTWRALYHFAKTATRKTTREQAPGVPQRAVCRKRPGRDAAAKTAERKQRVHRARPGEDHRLDPVSNVTWVLIAFFRVGYIWFGCAKLDARMARFDESSICFGSCSQGTSLLHILCQHMGGWHARSLCHLRAQRVGARQAAEENQ